MYRLQELRELQLYMHFRVQEVNAQVAGDIGMDCILICICMYTDMYTYIQIYIHTYRYTYIQICIHTYLYTYISATQIMKHIAYLRY